MIVECQKCGAPLSAVEGQRLVQCAYCGATSQVRSMRTTAQQTPPGWQPPAMWQPPPQAFQAPMPAQPYVYRPAPVPARSGAAAAVIVAVVAVMVVSGAVGAIVLGGGTSFGLRVDPDAPATVETITVGADAPVSRVIPGVAGGSIRGGSLQSRCRGYFPVAPQFSLRLTAIQRVRLTTLGSDDLTMALRDPSGTWRCDDDGGAGSNPLLDVTLAPGVYPVWIGTYRQRHSAAFSFQVQSGESVGLPSGVGLAVTAPPTLGSVALSGPSTLASRSGLAGGPIDANSLGNNCRGHIPSAPHLVLTTADFRRVVLQTTGTRDLTMVVRDDSGAVHCDDDSGGATQPRIETLLAPGRHHVWIGTYSANESSLFTLRVSSQSAGTAAPLGNGLSPESPPTVSAIDLDRAASTTSLRGAVVGTLEARTVSPTCLGYLTMAPQLRLTTRSARHVSITATSSTDLTMLARGPSGDVVCADDSGGGSNPTIEADIAPGETTVWIGTFASSRRAAFRVQVTAQAPTGALPVK